MWQRDMINIAKIYKNKSHRRYEISRLSECYSISVVQLFPLFDYSLAAYSHHN